MFTSLLALSARLESVICMAHGDAQESPGGVSAEQVKAAMHHLLLRRGEKEHGLPAQLVGF